MKFLMPYAIKNFFSRISIWCTSNLKFKFFRGLSNYTKLQPMMFCGTEKVQHSKLSFYFVFKHTRNDLAYAITERNYPVIKLCAIIIFGVKHVWCHFNSSYNIFISSSKCNIPWEIEAFQVFTEFSCCIAAEQI